VCLRASTVVCEDFERPDKSKWSDYKNNALYVEHDQALGGKQSLRQYYERDQSVAGWLGWHFGDHPEGGVRKGEHFEDIYFRFYHRFPKNWPDQFPPKFARVGSRYAGEGLLHAWQEQLLISGRRPGGTPISSPISSLEEPGGTRHMGDGNLRWLDRQELDVRFAERKGEWVAIEMRVKLNTPGQSDGRVTYDVEERPASRVRSEQHPADGTLSALGKIVGRNVEDFTAGHVQQRLPAIPTPARSARHRLFL